MIPRIRKQYLKRAPILAWNIALRGHYDFTYDRIPFVLKNMSLRKRLNLLATGMNLFHRKTRPWSWPTHFMVELTNTCNLKCPVCPTGSGLLERDRGFLDLKLYERMMKEVGPRLLMIFLWGWGEPLLHPSFNKFVRIARNHNVIPVLSTNGQSLIKEEVREKLLMDPPTQLIVAIDGLTDETNTHYRVGARMDLTLEGVHKLLEERQRRIQDGPHINMRYIVMEHNEHEVEQVESFARQHGFDSLSLRSLSTVEHRDNAQRNLAPTVPEYKAYNHEDGAAGKRENFTCHIAFTFPAMFVDGTITACDQDANALHAIGRFEGKHSFKDIWFGHKAAAVRKIIRDDRNRFSFCRACPFAERDSNTCNISAKVLRK